jgi:Outer membrane protein beta-barrel domain
VRKFLLICGAVLCLSLTAAAQDRPPWQLGIGYQYEHFGNIDGQTFHNNALNVNGTRYLTDWFGIEGEIVPGFGHTGGTRNLVAKSLLFVGGIHLAIPNDTRWEPWVHVLAGGEHFRFTQTNILGSMTSAAYVVGGGVDFKLAAGLSWRFQGDYFGTHITTPTGYRQNNYSFGSGLVFNF